MQLNRLKVILSMPFIALIITGQAQTIQITDNKKPEYEKNYVSKESLSDTTYILLDFKRALLDVRKEVKDLGEYKMDYIVYTLRYSLPTPSNNWVYFFHMASPPFGHEEYCVKKSSVPKGKIVLEFNKSSLFWYQNYLSMMESVVILIDLKDWDSGCDWVKGIGITVNTNTIE
jgi:hypothetical protein